MTKERLRKVRTSLSFQNSKKHTIYQHWFRVFQQYAAPASRDLQRTGTVPFFPPQLQKRGEKGCKDKPSRCVPPNAQKTPSAVPGDIPDLCMYKDWEECSGLKA